VPKPRVCAVSYLNTVPLVWGMVHGPRKGECEVFFRLPAECADMLAEGSADIGIVPVYELGRQVLDIIPGLGIACRGAVRSILLISKQPPERIRTLAADTSSRTSVQLARVILERRFGARPVFLPHPPDLTRMMETSDAALIIGDPALRVDTAACPYRVYDLGQEWWNLTRLPMVFAVWAGRPGTVNPAVTRLFHDSWRYGLASMEQIVESEAAGRGFAPGLVRQYLTRYIRHELGPAEEEGLRLFLRYAGVENSRQNHAKNAP
jgi:chorismate dehydratase